MGAQSHARAVSGLPSDTGRLSPENARAVVDRAVGLLAGRARCRLADAHRHLLRMAAEQRCEAADVAGRVIRMFDGAGDCRVLETVPQIITAALVDAPRTGAEPTVQAVLDAMPGMAAYLTPERDLNGRLIDLVWAAATPEAVTPDGRHGNQLIGQPVSRFYPEVFAGGRRQVYQRVLETGEPADLGPVRIGEASFTVRAGQLGPGLLVSWQHRQAGAERLAEVEHQLDEQRRTLAAETDLTARLQRIILPIPEEPIDLPGLRAAVRYLPAGDDTMVGGDWYHAAALRDGSVLLAVGDVAGHGAQAATTMAQLRHALRVLSILTSDPGTLLEHLNRLTCELERESPELAATAVIARFDPRRRELVWAQAGHPPPLLSRGGRTVPLTRPAGTMLGVVEDARYRDAVTEFRAGDVLLLYTDGLVEHRQRSLDVGLDAVIATVDDAVRVAPQQPLAELLARLRRANPDDDTCILAARPRRTGRRRGRSAATTPD